MLKIPAIVLISLLGCLALTACSSLNQFRSPAAAPALTDYVHRGDYAVGIRALYFHDPDRPFDPWNAKHASPIYQSLTVTINNAGDTQIVSTLIWYPVDPADTTRPATYDDIASSSRSLALNRAYQSNLHYYLGSLTDGATAGPDLFSDPAVAGPVAAALKRQLVNARYEAPIAAGKFPILIAAHGLGGSAQQWFNFAEYFASHGYVVIAPSFISDSSLPDVIDSPDSQFGALAGTVAIERGYATILSEPKVISGFYKYLFDDSAPGSPTALPDGSQKVGEMMAELFTQRVADVSTIIDGLHNLNQDKDACVAAYADRGQTNHGPRVCGRFTDSFDLHAIGIAGHSLGSMTAQFAVARDYRIAAAAGYNNGPPRLWEPPGVFGSGRAADDQPAGNPKPVMQIHGSEDAFVQSVFRGLLWNQFAAAGGNPAELWTLEPERALPTDENPQPVARNAYARATGDKVIISVKDVNHDALIADHLALFTPDAPLTVNGKQYWNELRPARRKAVGPDVLNPAFQGPTYTPLNRGVIGDTQFYLPILIRNYYTKNWFDYHLKYDQTALRFTENFLPNLNIIDHRHHRPGN